MNPPCPTRRELVQCAAASVLCLSVASGAAPPSVRVLVVTGGHDFERDAFTDLLNGLEGVTWREAQHPRAHALLKPEAARDYDVLLLYDMWPTISDEARADFVSLLRHGKGVVALHHSLGAYPTWDEYPRIVGGRFHLAARVVDGVEKPGSTYRHGVRYRVRIADRRHAIARGVEDFDTLDETYGQFDVLPQAKPLLTTDEPSCGPTIGWTHTYGRSRVCYILLGHDRAAYENPAYRRLVRQAIEWAAGRRR